MTSTKLFAILALGQPTAATSNHDTRGSAKAAGRVTQTEVPVHVGEDRLSGAFGVLQPLHQLLATRLRIPSTAPDGSCWSLQRFAIRPKWTSWCSQPRCMDCQANRSNRLSSFKLSPDCHHDHRGPIPAKSRPPGIGTSTGFGLSLHTPQHPEGQWAKSPCSSRVSAPASITTKGHGPRRLTEQCFREPPESGHLGVDS